MTLTLLFLAAAFLAYANGANDNLKGVATLLGSRTLGYRGALAWGTATTFAGSMCSLLLASGLVKAFSGKGIVVDALVGEPTFALAVGLGAASTVILATVLGLPISTTHSLVGGLAGAAVGAAGAGAVHWSQLGAAFALPLLLSPLLAAAVTAILYPLFSYGRRRLGVDHRSRLEVPLDPPGALPATARLAMATEPAKAPAATGVLAYEGTVLGVSAQGLLNTLHYLSAGAVSFARGLNDTPKIAALLLVGGSLAPGGILLMVAVAMALGAVAQAAKVARRMSFEITPMNSGQGFTANLATAVMVFGASRLGIPVSTTHVSVGSLFGLGSANRSLDRGTFLSILLAWAVTLPSGFVCAFAAYRLAASAGL